MALVALGITAVVLGVWNLNGAAIYMDDEGTYTAQAFSVLEGRLAPYTYRYDHPPVGWIQLGALAWIPQLLGVGDGTVIGATRYAMVPFFVATALLIYLIARRLELRRPFAVLAVVLFVLSPLSLVYGRQIFLDNIGVPWLLLAFWMVMSPRAALWHHIWAGAFFAVAVLSKETLAVFGPALLVALLNRPTWSNRAFSVMGFLVVGGTVLNFYPLMAILSGELWSRSDHVSLQDAFVFQFLSRAGSGSLWDPASVRAERLQSWLYYDQYLITAGVVAGIVCLLQRRTVWIPVALATFAVPVVVGQGYLPGMYIIGALPFLALAVGAGLETLWERLEKYTATLAAQGQVWARRAGVACIVVGLLPVAHTQWFEQDRRLLTRQVNTDWASALEWVQGNVPKEDTVLVPYVMWQDLIATDGRNDPWSVVATEKADLDPQFLVEHPGGWKEIEWVVVGPSTDETIDGLDLGTVRQALDHSVPVHTVGEWSVHHVQRD
ncbi:glycosyltransferase family 39 protein [Kocuria turfanensis]|uniref:Glycosyltransferase RgtA/B/C/D-like domain-containing protein n=1 Tax=Kocuria turfanensis TaxID=388357 RepID=A0A512IA96_9MICC|nr:glycosyltransferase family 39 protein [Kocuria turfanensis]GEO94623.1 hypothetical protein KTU01_07460 [Kocuria turfanensis]